MVGQRHQPISMCCILRRVWTAISTLLQPPLVRTGVISSTNTTTSAFKTPTSKDIPPVPLTNIPHVETKCFQTYLSQVGSLYDAFQRAREESECDGQLSHREKEDIRSETRENLLVQKLPRPNHSRAGSVRRLVTSPLDATQPTRRSSGQRSQRTVTPLSTIPTVYFEEKFHLENPRTFDIVSEWSEVARDPSKPLDGSAERRKALATNAILQERLSWYMDTVEIHLIASISKASKSFFSALGALRELHADAAESVDQIQRLRKDLAKLDNEMAMGGLKVVKLKQRRDNVRQLAGAVMQLQEFVSSVTRCEGKVDNGEIEGSLDDLDDVERLMAGIPAESGSRHGPHMSDSAGQRDLRGIRALDGASEDLRRLRQKIGKGYEARFLDRLLGDLRRHIDCVESKTTLQRWGSAFNRARPGHQRASSVFPVYMNVDEVFRAKLRTELNELSRAKYTASAATAFKASVLREMKGLIRKHLPSSSDDDAESVMSASTHGGRQMSQQEKSSILARNLRSMDPEDAQTMLTNIYTSISEGLRRLGVQVKILLDVTSGLTNPATLSRATSPSNRHSHEALDGRLSPGSATRPLPSITVQAEIQQALDMSSLLGEAVDIVQGQITKIVKVRSEQTAHLSLVGFLRFFTLHRLFADECEAICGRSILPLKSVIDNQIKDFVSHFSYEQRHCIVEVMDSDKWDARDFNETDTERLTRILGGSTRDDLSWVATSMIWTSNADSTMHANGIVTNGIVTNGSKGTATGKLRSAVIDEQKFILPDSAISIVKAIESFQHLATGIPSMGQDTAAGLLECLKLFNSRANQLILGAGATRSAGLKNITTKHLALSSQALSFIIALMPYIREFFRRHVPASGGTQVLGEFDKVKRLYQEHQNGVHEKMVEIMSSRASFHLNAMKKIDWEQAALSKGPAPSPYMEALTKETNTLQKVLAKHLPETTLAAVMQPVFASFEEQLSKAFREVPVRSVAAKERYVCSGTSSDRTLTNPS